MRHHHVNVLLPNGWREVPSQGARAFRPACDDAGWLHVSLYPPKHALNNNDAAITAALDELLAGLGLELGQCVHHDICSCTLGRMATSIWKSPKQGLMQFWLTPSDALVFASFTMGNLRTVRQEMRDAQSIVESIQIVDVTS